MDKECPNWSFYEAKQLKAAYWIETNEEEDLENYYSSVYSILVTEQMTSETKQESVLDFDKAALWDEEAFPSRECKSIENILWKRQTVFLEEEVDDHWR